jgi:hypothetical protein
MARFFKAKARDPADVRMTGNVTYKQSFTAKFRGAEAKLATSTVRFENCGCGIVRPRALTP